MKEKLIEMLRNNSTELKIGIRIDGMKRIFCITDGEVSEEIEAVDMHAAEELFVDIFAVLGHLIYSNEAEIKISTEPLGWFFTSAKHST